MSVPMGILVALDRRFSNVWNPMRMTLGNAAARVKHFPGVFALCDQGIVSLTNFATGVIIGRACGRAELGVYTLAWTLMTLATEIPATVTTTPYTVFGPQLTEERRSRYLGSILIHQLAFSLLFALLLAAGAILGPRWGWLPANVSSAVLATAGVIVFIGLREFVRRVSFAELKMASALRIDSAACLLQAVGVLLLFHYHVLNASRIYVLLGISSASVAAAWLVFHWKAIHLDKRDYARDLKRNWNFSKWVLGSWTLYTIAVSVYPWMLAAFHGTAVTGTWAACVAIVALGNPVLLGLSNYVGPRIHNLYASSGAVPMQRYVYRASLLYAALILPVVLILVGFGGRIVTGVFGRAYAGNTGVVFLLALNLLIGACMYPYSRGLFSLERAKVDMLINVASVALMFTIGIAAVRSYAALGAAAALLVSSAITAVIRMRVFAREVRRSSGSPQDVTLPQAEVAGQSTY
jgi:O-antigen/teichoic acid export membrane protein